MFFQNRGTLIRFQDVEQMFERQRYINNDTLNVFFGKKTSRYACYTCEDTCELQVQVKQDIWLMALNGTSFRGPRIWLSSLATYNPSRGVKTPNWSDFELESSKEKQRNRPTKPPKTPRCQWDFDIDFTFFFWPMFLQVFLSFGKECNGFFVWSPCFLPGPPNPATLWKLKQVRCGVRFCLGGVMSVWYRSTLLECFKWFAWWQTDGGFWMAYPFWQYYKARVELALPISSSETGPAGTTAFDALLFSVR